MKHLLMTAAVAVTTCINPVYAADVGVSVSIGQPGFYGRLDIGGYPPPRLLYPQPIIIQQVPVYGEPLYLRVPPGHAKHWSKHCYKYQACGEQVYFVRDDWYQREYVPRYREHHGDRYDGDHRHRGRDHDDHDRGHGKGKDHGHGHGRGHDR